MVTQYCVSRIKDAGGDLQRGEGCKSFWLAANNTIRGPGLRPSSPQCLLAWNFLVVGAVQHVFHERHAVKVHELDVLFHAAIERKAHLPGPRENVRILYAGFVHDVVWADQRIAFDYVQRIAMVISRPVEPSP